MGACDIVRHLSPGSVRAWPGPHSGGLSGGAAATLIVLLALNYRPSQIRRDRALRHERCGVRW